MSFILAATTEACSYGDGIRFKGRSIKRAYSKGRVEEIRVQLGGKEPWNKKWRRPRGKSAARGLTTEKKPKTMSRKGTFPFLDGKKKANGRFHIGNK